MLKQSRRFFHKSIAKHHSALFTLQKNQRNLVEPSTRAEFSNVIRLEQRTNKNQITAKKTLLKD